MLESEGTPKLIFFNNIYNREGIIHFVSTRIGGISNHPFSSLNLGYSTGDRKDFVDKNWQLVKNRLNISGPFHHIILNQIHSDIIIEINNSSKLKNSNNLKGDAIITNIKRVLINVLTADCVPVLLYDPVKSVIATIHAGWRGTAKRIVIKTVLAMKENFQSSAKNILACIGPSIGPCCYEVKDDVSSVFLPDYPESVEVRKGKTYLNLVSIVKDQLIIEGLSEGNIETSNICTKCNSHIFYSSRAAGNLPTGRFATGIMLV